MGRRWIGPACWWLAGCACGALASAGAQSHNGVAAALAGPLVNVWEVAEPLISRDAVGGGWSRILVTSRGERRKVEVTPLVRRGEPVVRVRDGDGVHYVTVPGYSQQRNLLIVVESGPPGAAGGSAGPAARP